MKLRPYLFLLLAGLALSDIEVTMFYFEDQPELRTLRTIPIAIDSLDNIWVGTWPTLEPGVDSIGGVYRYDGSSWDHWTIASTGGDLLDNDIFDIEVAPDGKVWIATGFAATLDTNTAVLYYFDYDDERWHRVGPEDGLPRWWYRDIEFDYEGNLWACDNKCYMSMFNGISWTNYYLVDVLDLMGPLSMIDFAIDEHDHLWGSLAALDTLYEFRDILYNKYPLDTTGVGLIPPPPRLLRV